MDYSKLLGDTELKFAVGVQRFPANRCVLAAQSPYFRALFKLGKGMHEEGSRAAGEDIVIKDVSAGAFRVLLKFLYAHTLPEKEDCGEGLAVGEMVRVADRFQASELYALCVEQFMEGLVVGNVVARLVHAHDSGLAELQETSMDYFKANALAFEVSYVCSAPGHICCISCRSAKPSHSVSRSLFQAVFLCQCASVSVCGCFCVCVCLLVLVCQCVHVSVRVILWSVCLFHR